MNEAFRIRAEPRHGPATEAAHEAPRQGAGGFIVDNRLGAAAQRRLGAAIHLSPQMAAQRRLIGSMFGTPAQLVAGLEADLQMKPVPALLQRQAPKQQQEPLRDERLASIHANRAGGTVAQLILGRLGAYTVQEEKYSNNSWDTIATHMKGEWDGENSHAVTGGHLLNGMTSQWGPVQYSVVRAAANVNASGVFFENANNLPKHIEGTQHAYYLARVNGNQKKLSNAKQSSFWPKDWSLANLKAALDASYTTNQANVYASKANTSYWYTWQTLGDNTVFPVARYPKLE